MTKVKLQVRKVELQVTKVELQVRKVKHFPSYDFVTLPPLNLAHFNFGWYAIFDPDMYIFLESAHQAQYILTLLVGSSLYLRE